MLAYFQNATLLHLRRITISTINFHLCRLKAFEICLTESSYEENKWMNVYFVNRTLDCPFRMLNDSYHSNVALADEY